MIGVLHLDYYQQPKKHELSIICSDGTIHWEYETSDVRIEKASGEIVQIGTSQIYERNQMYLAEMSHFLDICKKHETKSLSKTSSFEYQLGKLSKLECKE